MRTRAQKQHDALATALSVAARSGELPTLGGAAPTLVVSVRAADLAAGTGYAHLDGTDQPVPIGVARHTGCDGVIQRVLMDDTGRIVSIGTLDRVFNHHQRKAITLRDGSCIIPGCHVPASWCEIHHVTDHASGGPTHTDNGVLLCWHHHRTLNTNGWAIRMHHGTPHVRGPSWWDPDARWRPTTKSPTRLHDRIDPKTMTRPRGERRRRETAIGPQSRGSAQQTQRRGGEIASARSLSDRCASQRSSLRNRSRDEASSLSDHHASVAERAKRDEALLEQTDEPTRC